ncbi:hypothetical protein V6N11_039716, partial [Hibiscus sabdariffa]
SSISISSSGKKDAQALLVIQ